MTCDSGKMVIANYLSNYTLPGAFIGYSECRVQLFATKRNVLSPSSPILYCVLCCARSFPCQNSEQREPNNINKEQEPALTGQNVQEQCHGAGRRHGIKWRKLLKSQNTFYTFMDTLNGFNYDKVSANTAKKTMIHAVRQ